MLLRAAAPKIEEMAKEGGRWCVLEAPMMDFGAFVGGG